MKYESNNYQSREFFSDSEVDSICQARLHLPYLSFLFSLFVSPHLLIPDFFFPCTVNTQDIKPPAHYTSKITVKYRSQGFVCPAKFKLYSNNIQICSSSSLNVRRHMHLSLIRSDKCVFY